MAMIPMAGVEMAGVEMAGAEMALAESTPTPAMLGATDYHTRISPYTLTSPYTQACP
jgi:hypothetical protein